MSEPKLDLRNLNVSAGDHPILCNINLAVQEHEILGIIGPAHSGKTTLLRIINRLDEGTGRLRRTGKVLLDGVDVAGIDLTLLRRRVGMVFATPIPLPGTIFANVAYGPRVKGIHHKAELEAIVERTLRAAFLWDEASDRLHTSASCLSGGQQQRLCIARTMAVDPEVIMMDEPCSGLDPITTAKIEDAMRELKRQYTFILVTNNTKQAARVSDRVAFFLSGELVELGQTGQIFTAPQDSRTDDYISGRIG